MSVTVPSSRWALVSLSLAMLSSSLGTSIASIALPTLSASLGESFQSVQWVVLGYLVSATALGVSAGRLGDLVGRRRLFLSGIALFTLASAACALAPSLPVLIGARVAQGLGAAVMMTLALALSDQSGARGRTGSVMGLLGMLSAVGTAIGPSLGGALLAAAGWRSIFLAGVPAGLATLIIGWRFLREDSTPRQTPRTTFDVRGTVLLALTLAAYALAMTVNAWLLVAAVLLVVLFVRTRSRTAPRLFDAELLRTPTLRPSLVASALVMTVVMATVVVGPFYLVDALALSAADAGLVLSVGPAVAAIASIPAGRLVDRIGGRRSVLIGLAAIGAGAALVATMPADAGVAGYVLRIALITAGHAVFQTANNAVVMAAAPSEDRGVVAGLLGLSRNLGLITGASAMAMVFELSSASVLSGLHATFTVATALMVIALGVALARSRRRTMPEWGIAAGLIALTLVPAVAGSARIAEIVGGAAVTPQNARFLESPVPVVLHITASVLFCILGAFQFLPRFRARRPRWHRVAGWVALPSGVVSAGSALWMTITYPWPTYDGVALYWIRLAFGTAMLASLWLGVAAVRRRDLAAHRAWMMRAYAIGIAAGTQVLTHLPWFLAPEIRGELARTILMFAGWGINLAFAEWLIARDRVPHRRRSSAVVPDPEPYTLRPAAAGITRRGASAVAEPDAAIELEPAHDGR